MKILLGNMSMGITPDTEISLSLINPIFNDQGSFGIGITLPATPSNLKQLGYPNRPDRRLRIGKEFPCTIISGVISLYGTAIIQGISSGGIDLDITLSEGDFYDTLSQVQLNQIVVKKTHYPSISSSPDFFVDLTNSVKSDNGEYTVFELCTKITETNGRTEYQIKNYADPDGTYGTKSGKTYNGYAPFLYLHYVLSQVYEYFSITQTNNPFSQGELRRLVLLNNASSAIDSGWFKYENLVPDVSALDLQTCVEDKFGCRFIVDYNKRAVRCVFLKDIHNALPTKDWSSKLNGILYPVFETPQKLRLSSATSLDKAAPSFTNWRQWLTSDQSEVLGYEDLIPGSEQISYVKKYGWFARRLKTGILDIKSSAHFSFADLSFYNEAEITTADEAISMINASYYTVLDYVNQYYPYFPVEQKSISKTVNEDGSTTEASDASCPIAFCFAQGFVPVSYTSGPQTPILGKRKPTGSPFGTNLSTNQNVGDLQLGNLSLEWISSRGLFRHYYQEHNEFLKRANQTFKGNFILTPQDIMNIKWEEKITINNQPYFIDKIDITLLANDTIRTENVELKQARLFDES